MFCKRPGTRLIASCDYAAKLQVIDGHLVVFQPGEPPFEITADEQLIPWTPETPEVDDDAT